MRMSINNASPGLRKPFTPKMQFVKTLCQECKSIVYVTQDNAPHGPDEGIGYCTCGGDTCGCPSCQSAIKQLINKSIQISG